MREFVLFDIKYYYKTIIIKAIRYWYKYGQKATDFVKIFTNTE